MEILPELRRRIGLKASIRESRLLGSVFDRLGVDFRRAMAFNGSEHDPPKLIKSLLRR